jgi:hypothetical protein
MVYTMNGTHLDTPLKYPDRIALMVRWLQHNEALIRQFDAGGLEFNFAGDEVFGRIVKANLAKPDKTENKRA